MRKSLLSWQWSDYGDHHEDRANLLLHIVAVPLFVAGNVAVVAGIVLLLWWLPLVGITASALAMAVQGVGHGREANPPKPFDGPVDAVTRIFVEQWVTFWRFVITGGWWRAMRPR